MLPLLSLPPFTLLGQNAHHAPTMLTTELECEWVQVILMDHMDWQDLTAPKDLAQVLARQVVPGGCVIWRSAAEAPKYAQLVRLQRAEQGYMDRVNMYSSFYVAVRRGSSHLTNGSSHVLNGN